MLHRVSSVVTSDCNRKTVSVIIPCYSSENYLEDTVNRIRTCFSMCEQYDYRIILINDCSPDKTFDVIRKLCQEDPYITGVDLEENQGQTKAKMIGYRFLEGDYAVFMDDDGQHRPEDLFLLLNRIDEGYEIVYAQFPVLEESLFRKAASQLTDWILTLSGTKPYGLRITSYIAISGKAMEYIKKLEQYDVFLYKTLEGYTKRVGRVLLAHGKRVEGKSRYSLKKLIHMWFGVIISEKIVIPKDDGMIREIINDTRSI